VLDFTRFALLKLGYAFLNCVDLAIKELITHKVYGKQLNCLIPALARIPNVFLLIKNSKISGNSESWHLSL